MTTAAPASQSCLCLSPDQRSENAHKYGAFRPVACLSGSEIRTCIPKFGSSLWRTFRKFPFCGVVKRRFGSTTLCDRGRQSSDSLNYFGEVYFFAFR
jgi:hypothetical protein